MLGKKVMVMQHYYNKRHINKFINKEKKKLYMLKEKREKETIKYR